jgi:hypothetical protein
MKKPASQPPTVAIALMVACMLAISFIAIVAAVLPQVLFMVATGAGLVLFFVAQYFVWARWMYPIVVRMEQDAAKEAANAKMVAGITERTSDESGT